MWLINTQSLRLEWFSDPISSNAQYAILSHTWERDEVSFQDFADPNHAHTKQGFAKILQTCELAKSQGLSYAWVDTCCINKESSAELSEAINSMYQWYQAAQVCYVFLFDLDVSPFQGLYETLEISNQQYLMSHRNLVLRSPMARCRWWTRGWTLQELIAPDRVMFYDSSWQYIDDKSSLRYLIEIITGISADILINQSRVLTQSVWQRMSWARSRETTRTEDIAYCLLGLFDISMPMVYGEGYKAFQRLQEEITRKEGDPSIFLWSPDTMPRRQYRPPQYRQSTTTPEIRGAFAWAPSEFLSPEIYFDVVVTMPRYDAIYTAVPCKVQMSAQSSCTLQNGVICISTSQDEFAGTYPHTYLELYTSRGFMYRPVEKVADGYVFGNRPYCIRQDRLVPQKDEVLTLMSHHKTMLLELEERKRVCVGIDSEAMESAQCISWPSSRWEEARSWWVYDDVEVSRASYSMATVLGICWFPLTISIQTSQQLTTNHRITVACVVGLHPSQTMEALAFQSTSTPRFFGACFVKESMSSFASLIHMEIADSDLKAGASVIQALSLEKLEKFKSGRSEIIVLAYGHDNLTRVRAICNYSPSTINHRSSTIWRIRIEFEHEEEYFSDQWVAFDPDEAINIH